MKTKQTHVASGDIGAFTEGQSLDTTAKLGAYFRTIMAENDATTDLSDDAIGTIADGIARGDMAADDWEIAVLEAIEEGADGETDVDEAGEASEDVKGLLAKIEADPLVTRWVNAVIEGQEKVDAGPLHIAARFLADWSASERAVMPWPGSKVAVGNLPVDYYERPRIVDGVSKPIKGSIVRDFCLGHSVVMAIQSKLDELAKAKAEKSAIEGANGEYAKLYRRYTSRKASAIKALTRALKVMHMTDRLGLDGQPGHPHVFVEFETEQQKNPKTGKMDTVLSTSKYPITLIDRHKQRDFIKLSVSTFINLKPEPSTRLADMAKTARAKKAPVSAVDKLNIEASNVELVIAKTVNALENNGIFAALRGMVNNPKSDEARHLRLTLVAMEDKLAELLDPVRTGKNLLVQADREWEKAQGNSAEQTAA